MPERFCRVVLVAVSVTVVAVMAPPVVVVAAAVTAAAMGEGDESTSIACFARRSSSLQSWAASFSFAEGSKNESDGSKTALAVCDSSSDVEPEDPEVLVVLIGAVACATVGRLGTGMRVPSFKIPPVGAPISCSNMEDSGFKTKAVA